LSFQRSFVGDRMDGLVYFARRRPVKYRGRSRERRPPLAAPDERPEQRMGIEQQPHQRPSQASSSSGGRGSKKASVTRPARRPG